MVNFDFDNSNIHQVYRESRKLPDETVLLWLNSIGESLPVESICSILDLGCGTGRFTRILSEYFDADVYGIDPSEKMLSVAIENINSPRIVFLRGNAESIPLDNNEVDLIFMSHVYHHIQDTDTSVSEIRRVLRKKKFLCVRQTPLEYLDSFIYLASFPPQKKLIWNVCHRRKT